MISDRRLFDSWPSVLVSGCQRSQHDKCVFLACILYYTELLMRISRIRLTKVLLYCLKGEICQKTSKILSSTNVQNVHRRSKAGKSLSDYLKLE